MFKLYHRGGKYVHPLGGEKHPADNTKLVLWEGDSSGVGGSEALCFTMSRCSGGYFKMKHFGGKYVHPYWGSTANDTRLVLHNGDVSELGGTNHCKFKLVPARDGYVMLEHHSGQLVHPDQGKLTSPNDCCLVLHSSRTGANGTDDALSFKMEKVSLTCDASILHPKPVLDKCPRLHTAWERVDEATVDLMFKTTTHGNYATSRVTLVRNHRFLRMCSDMLDNLDDRRAGPLKGIFSYRYPTDLDSVDEADKVQLIQTMKRHFKTEQWAEIGRGCANVLPVWHGAHESAIRGISEVGFAALVRDDADDPGWHSNGRYNTLEAGLAALYATDYPEPKAPNADGEFCVLLSAAVVGLAYPITPGREDFPTGSLPPTNPENCRFYGRGFNAPCDTHIAAIDGNTMICTKPARAMFHEIVSAQDAQLLPLAVVYFKKL